MNEVDFKLSKKQAEFLEALKSKKYKYLCYGGAAGGGKSYLGSFIILACALQYSDTRYAIVRKNLTVLKRTSLITFRKVLNQLGIEADYNGSLNCYTFKNGSQVYFVEADTTKDRELLKLAGLEVTGILIEQADEVEELAFSIAMIRKGRENTHKIETATGKKIPYVHEFIILTTNPTQNWLKDKFYTPHKLGKLEAPFYYLSALATDNPFNTKEYLESLKDLPEAQRRQYLEGDWDYADDPNQLINFAWVRDSMKEEQYLHDRDLTQYMGIDIARFGDDRTVFMFMQEGELYDMQVFQNQDELTTADKAEHEARDRSIGYEHIGADVANMGAGTVDLLVRKGMNIYPFNSAETPQGNQGFYKFGNKRAEAYWLLREDLKAGNITINVNIKPQEILKELMQIRYLIKGDKIYIEEKEAIKKRLGKSPDLADAFVICNYMRHCTGMSLEFEIDEPAFSDVPSVRIIKN